MGNVSKPLIVLLVGTVAFFALWVVALKPGGSGSSQSQGLGAYQGAINKAHQAVANSVSAAHGASVGNAQTTAQPAAATTTPATVSSTSQAKPAAKSATHLLKLTPGERRSMVARAIAQGKVVAMLFFNPAATDDQAVKQELSGVPADGGKVVKLAVPLSELSQYGMVTSQVPVSQSPSLVIIDRNRQASMITGFADGFEIDQRVSEALAE